MLVVETMRKRVDANLTSIRATEKKIRLLLKEPVSDNRTRELEVFFAKNRKLLEENKVALAIQLNILDYLRYYGEVLENPVLSSEENESNSNTNTAPNSNLGGSSSLGEELDDDLDAFINDDTDDDDDFVDEEDMDEVEYDRNIFFQNIIKGTSTYNHKHLLWDDEEFYLNLINYYITEENYEACAKLQTLRKEM